MKTLMIAAALATATAGLASAETTVNEKRAQLDRIFAEQRAAQAQAQVSTDAQPGFLDRIFDRDRISFGVVAPDRAERGADFRRFGSDTRAGR
ncbi:MAG: hypothetical protein AAGF44_04355 [Pseudomonadota bacterium]